MKGWIFGSEHQKQWTQKIFKHTAKFQNPLHQNYKHLKTLAVLLSIENEVESHCVFSVVIFIGDSTFKTKMPENVTFARGGIKYIKRKTDVVFNTEDVERIIHQIESDRLVQGAKTNRDHIKHVQGIIEHKSNATITTNICAKCGANMILRKAKKGNNTGNEFWGGSTFPKCRNIVNSKC